MPNPEIYLFLKLAKVLGRFRDYAITRANTFHFLFGRNGNFGMEWLGIVGIPIDYLLLKVISVWFR